MPTYTNTPCLLRYKARMVAVAAVAVVAGIKMRCEGSRTVRPIRQDGNWIFRAVQACRLTSKAERHSESDEPTAPHQRTRTIMMPAFRPRNSLLRASMVASSDPLWCHRNPACAYPLSTFHSFLLGIYEYLLSTVRSLPIPLSPSVSIVNFFS